MRYTEKDLKTKYESFTEYLSSIVELLILSPFRLVNEISKKVVYLEKKRIEKMLLMALAISVLVIGIEFVVGASITGISFKGGKFPLMVQALAPIIIALIYGFVKNYDYSLTSQFSEILSNHNNSDYENEKETEEPTENVVPTFVEGETDQESTDEFDYNDGQEDFNQMQFTDPEQDTFPTELPPFNPDELGNGYDGGISMNQFMEELEDSEDCNQECNSMPEDLESYDCAGLDPKQLIIPELLGNPTVKEHRERHENTVSKLQQRDKKITHNSLFNEQELQMIQKMCDDAVKESKYVDDNLIEIMLRNQAYDDFSQVDDFMKNDNVEWLQNIK